MAEHVIRVMQVLSGGRYASSPLWEPVASHSYVTVLMTGTLWAGHVTGMRKQPLTILSKEIVEMQGNIVATHTRIRSCGKCSWIAGSDLGAYSMASWE